MAAIARSSVGWRELALEDVAEVTVGHVGPMASEYVASGVPFLRSQNVDRLQINTKDLKYINDGFHARLGKSALSPGDVVIVRTGKPGTCSVIPDWLEHANCSDLVIVRCKPALDPHFLAYFVNSSAAGHIDAHLVGAVQQHFNVGAARSIRILLPSITEQRHIVAILRGLDDKIELNRRMNETLEAMARALFQSWFVDFDPVRAKVAGQRPAGMSAETSKLFPSTFEESTLGEVPRGWGTVGALSLFSLVSGGTPKTDVQDYWGGPIMWASAKDVSQGSSEFFLLETERRITQRGVDSSATKIVPSGAVVVVARGATCGRHVVLGEAMAMNQTCYALVPRRADDQWFVCFCATDLIRHLVKQAHGSVFDTITTATFERGTVILPPESLRAAFAHAASPSLERIHLLQRQNATLATLRDTLLPKLLSGELSVPEAETAVGKAL